MKRAIVYYPNCERKCVEIADLHDILETDGSQQLGNTAFFRKLQEITYGYVLVLVHAATESEHDVCVYVVPVESGVRAFSAKEIVRIVREVFGMELDPQGSGPASDTEKAYTLGSALIACVHQSPESSDSDPEQPIEDWCMDQVQHSNSSCLSQYKHEKEFGSPVEAMLHSSSGNQAEVISSDHVLEVENSMRRKMGHGELEESSGHNEDAWVRREFVNSISFDITPAFLSNSNDYQDFIRQRGHNEDATLTCWQGALSISFDLVPAFLSITPEDQQGGAFQQHIQPIAERTDSSSWFEIAQIPPSVPPTTTTSRSSQSIQPQCTPPGRANNIAMVFQRPIRPPEGSDIMIPELKQTYIPPQCFRNGGRQQFVYPSLEPTRYRNLPDVRCNGFPLREELQVMVPDCTMIYSSPIFTANTHFSSGVDCKDMFPSPFAIQRAVPKIPVRLLSRLIEAHRRNLIPYHSDSKTLSQSAFIGVGGNGIVFEHVLKKTKYAVKWTKYNQQELNAWCKLNHPNLVPLCAVIHVDPGCYQMMPRMTGDLSCLVRSRSAGDLCKLALLEDEATWVETLRPNIRYILASILHGLAYLHSQGFQHCDLKESNILFSVKCKCTNILYCKCGPQDKFTIAISDFDSIKPFSSPGAETLHQTSGTPYYRPPEVYEGLVSPFGDIWSFGIIVCCLFHSYDERKKIIQECKVMARGYLPLPNSLPPEELFYSQQILLGLQTKSMQAPLSHDVVGGVLEKRLTPLARIAAASLKYDYKERPTVEQLLEDPFFY